MAAERHAPEIPAAQGGRAQEHGADQVGLAERRKIYRGGRAAERPRTTPAPPARGPAASRTIWIAAFKIKAVRVSVRVRLLHFCQFLEVRCVTNT